MDRFTPLFIAGLVVLAIGAVISFAAKAIANKTARTEHERARRILIVKVIGLIIALVGFAMVFNFFRV